jgi:hypothetical protein
VTDTRTYSILRLKGSIKAISLYPFGNNAKF